MMRICGFAAALVLTLSSPATGAEMCPEFKPGPKNNFAACEKLWGPIGTPEYANGDIDATPVCHEAYVLSLNNARRTPDWVLERLNKAQFAAGIDRPETKFKSEDLICGKAQAKDDDYTNSKMDRGHQAPSADFSSDEKLMVESFILSNAVPQVGIGFNRHIWKQFEDLTRKLAKDRGEIFVITGPINVDAEGGIPSIAADANPCKNEIKLEPPKRPAICGKAEKCPEDTGVTVPAALFKVIYDAKNKRANAYIMPNIDHRPFDKSKDPLEYLKKFRVAVRTVEQYTGLEFLSAIPKRDRKAQIEECVATMWH
jgi:DNA/RNA endonuclease G (NUC1)